MAADHELLTGDVVSVPIDPMCRSERCYSCNEAFPQG